MCLTKRTEVFQPRVNSSMDYYDFSNEFGEIDDIDTPSHIEFHKFIESFHPDVHEYIMLLLCSTNIRSSHTTRMLCPVKL